MKKTILALSVALLSSPSFSADLLAAWRAAQQHDASFLAARYAQTAGSEKANQGQALLLPSVTLGGNTTYSNTDFSPGKTSASVKDTQSSGQAYGYSITATQPVYRVDAFASADQLKQQAKLAEVQFRVAEQDLILRVAKAYFEVLAADEKVVLANAEKKAVGEQLAFAKKAFEVGVATIADTDEAQASYDTIVAYEIQAKNEQQVKRNAFTLLTAVNAESIARLSEKIEPTSVEPNDLSVWLKKSSDTSLNISGQLLQLDIATREVDKYRFESSPKVDLVANYGQNWDSSGISRSGGLDQTNKGAITLQLSIPLFTGGRRSSELREAAARQSEQRETLEATRRNTEQLTTQAFLGVNAGAAQITALEQVLKSSQSLLASSKLGRDVGVRTTVDVLNAERKLFSTRYDLTVARYTYLYTRLQLAAVTGDLDEKDLRFVNRWLVN
ncbi:TolC family outer membrane protein [Deefgea tanakiae]|uniref:TolC family outer membrane protein n=1 Tax=Deefgea tanakiae TaxID=2865840 RepID=A0ABX8Z5T0_9NEIS|nr:TolC family outer membrane protein [Deefgea tanakiae]QZA77932.1 TolC family outer membrane protein [Deefgea tanakiae]